MSHHFWVVKPTDENHVVAASKDGCWTEKMDEDTDTERWIGIDMTVCV